MSDASDHQVQTDEDLLRLDLPDLLRQGLPDVEAGPARRRLFGAGAVAAAITLDRLDVVPRSVTFLAEVVRAGGATYGAELAEPLPAPAASEAVSRWLLVAGEVTDDAAIMARWLDAVAALLDLRRRSRAEQPG